MRGEKATIGTLVKAGSARSCCIASGEAHRIVRTCPVLTFVRSGHRVPHDCSIHADVTRHTVPTAAFLICAFHVFAIARDARALRRLRAVGDRSACQSVRYGDSRTDARRVTPAQRQAEVRSEEPGKTPGSPAALVHSPSTGKHNRARTGARPQPFTFCGHAGNVLSSQTRRVEASADVPCSSRRQGARPPPRRRNTTAWWPEARVSASR